MKEKIELEIFKVAQTRWFVLFLFEFFNAF